jgi:hypothetical protein
MNRVFASAIFLAVTTPAFAYDDAAIREMCDAEWGTDFQMVAFCRDQQRQAGEKVSGLREQATGDDLTRVILNRCETEWGTDYAMIVFCHDQQVTAVNQLAAPPDDVPREVLESIRGQCDADWGNDFSMVAFCVDRQTAAWRSLQ